MEILSSIGMVKDDCLHEKLQEYSHSLMICFFTLPLRVLTNK